MTKFRLYFSYALWAAAACLLAGMAWMIVSGFPVELHAIDMRFKNLRKPYHLFLVFSVLGILLHPYLKEVWARLSSFASRMLTGWAAVWALFVFFAVIFVWQQISEYLAIKINFIPFIFYEYMLYYFDHYGMFNYTHILHNFYHLNNILLLLHPLWRIWQNPVFFVAAEGVLGALAVFPVVGIARIRFGKESLIPFGIGFIYLNYRFLYHLLEMNFGIEIFYPLIFLSLFWAFCAERWMLYYLFLFLAFLIKEDVFLYAAGFGCCALFWKGRRAHGLLTVVLSAVFALLVTKWFVPLTGNTILRGSVANFKAYGADGGSLLKTFIEHPFLIFNIMFGDPRKIETMFSLIYPLLFLPLFTPVAVMTALPLLPVFMHLTGRDDDFYNLHFHYAGAVIPFVFFAFICGFSNLYHRIKNLRFGKTVLAVLMLALLFINGGSYRSSRYDGGNLESIKWAKAVPPGNVVTHGHLMPYIGHRHFNYYFAQPWELMQNPYYRYYHNADYYLFDYSVNPYPMDEEYLRNFQVKIQARVEYELIRTDGIRFFFKRKDLR